MNTFLILFSLVLFFCVVLQSVSNKIGLPALLAFICLGMLFGSDGLVEIPFDDYHLAEDLCSMALIIIMFYGGFATRWKSSKKQQQKLCFYPQ